MKKFFAVLLVALCGAVPLFADDVADVKATIVKSLELDVKGDFAGALALYAPDYQETGADGVTVNYEQLRWMTLALDGKHPVEFLRFSYSAQNNGAMPKREDLPRIDRLARTPKFLKLYSDVLPELVAGQKADAALALKTLKFVSVLVDGDKAVAVVEYDEKDGDSNAIKRKTETLSLRKTDGKWMFYRAVAKDK